jgi:hypothetical protein
LWLEKLSEGIVLHAMHHPRHQHKPTVDRFFFRVLAVTRNHFHRQDENKLRRLCGGEAIENKNAEIPAQL